MPQDRRLAAIMFTDIVGYTKLMGKDEDQAFKILKINREIHSLQFERYNGTLIKEMGDGILASFPSALKAVQCAIAIQEEAKLENILLRIGIHEADVVFEGSDVLGDGVNVASRLEEMAEEGCINISGAVYKDIKNKAGIKADFLEEKTFKNVDEPVKVYKVHCEIKEETQEALPKKTLVKRSYYIIGVVVLLLMVAVLIWIFYPRKRAVIQEVEVDKSIAVLPFDNMSGDQDQEIMCDGLTEEIIHYLSTSKVFDKVISRSSVMTFKNSEKTVPEIARLLDVNFILEGSYRQSRDRLRITAQLIDASTDNHVWTEIYEQSTGDIFDIQSDIAKKIAFNLRGELSKGENKLLSKKPTDNLEAYNLYLKGRHFWHQRTEEDLKKSVYYFNQALKLDSTYALAYAGMADAYYIMVWYRWYPLDEGYKKSKELAIKALSINNDISEAHTTLGAISINYDWDWEYAEDKFRHAISLNPNYATASSTYSELMDILGNNKKARELITEALKLNPHSFAMNALSSIYYYHNTDYEKAIEETEKVLEIRIWYPSMIRILKSYIKLGRHQEAIADIHNMVSIYDTRNNQELLSQIYRKSGIEGIIHWFINWMLNNEQMRYINMPYFNYGIASLYAIIGESQKAIEYLEKGLKISEGAMPRINNNPDFDILRTDSRFIALLSKMQLL